MHQIQRAADYVDKILKAPTLAICRSEQPSRFELVVNFKSAKAFGITGRRGDPVIRRAMANFAPVLTLPGLRKRQCQGRRADKVIR